jgi:hypothetical protein
MDLIERLFHVSPDGGNGLTETSFLLIPLVALGLSLLIRRLHRQRP